MSQISPLNRLLDIYVPVCFKVNTYFPGFLIQAHHKETMPPDGNMEIINITV